MSLSDTQTAFAIGVLVPGYVLACCALLGLFIADLRVAASAYRRGQSDAVDLGLIGAIAGGFAFLAIVSVARLLRVVI